MRADCHMHMILDGVDWKKAIARHSEKPDLEWIRCRLEDYRAAGVAYLRDGGDRWGAGAAAKMLAPEYGICYRTPLAPLCHSGHYGAFIGQKFENLKEFAELIRKKREDGADFVKIMISGLMDFSNYGKLTEEGLEEKEIRELIRIAHEEGFAVMVHANGTHTVEAAASAGVDSVEHGAYLQTAALQAMKEAGTVWCPTISTVANLAGKGRFPEEQVQQIASDTAEKLRLFASMGGLIAPGSDAGAWAVPHGKGTLDEYAHLEKILGAEAGQILARGAGVIQEKF